MLIPRAIALQGVGYPPRLLALQGLYPVDEETPVDPNLVVMPFVLPRRRKKRRRLDEETLLFLIRR